MSDAVKVRCPQCKSMLRIPRAWLEQKIRCRDCAQSLRAAPNPKAAEPATAAPYAPAPPIAAPEPPPASDFVFDVLAAPNPGASTAVSAGFARSRAPNRLAAIGVLALLVVAGSAAGL